MKNRTTIQEIKALENIIEMLYNEKKYLTNAIETFGNDVEYADNVRIKKAQLQLVNHFIIQYEKY